MNFRFNSFRQRLRRYGDLLSCIDKKVGKEASPVLVQACVGLAFLLCPVLIRHPWLNKTGRDVHVAH